MGSKVDGLAVREDFLSKSAWKSPILAARFLDHLTLERASTHIFKDYDLFHVSFEKFGTKAFRWAIGRPFRIKIDRLAATWNFFAEGHQKMQKKVIFYIRAIYSSFWYWYPNPGYHHVKAHVLRIPKMSYFLGVGVSKGELLLLKVNRLWNFGSVSKIKRRCKKTTLR